MLEKMISYEWGDTREKGYETKMTWGIGWSYDLRGAAGVSMDDYEYDEMMRFFKENELEMIMRTADVPGPQFDEIPDTDMDVCIVDEAFEAECDCGAGHPIGEPEPCDGGDYGVSDEELEKEFADLPETKYDACYFTEASKAVRDLKTGCNQGYPVNEQDGDTDGGTDDGVELYGYWRKMAEIPKGVYDFRQPLGTEMANFLNFDVDTFVNGGYVIEWKMDGGVPTGVKALKKTNDNDLGDIVNRPLVVNKMQLDVFNNIWLDDIDVPFFITMFDEILVDYMNWEYKDRGVARIKSLQEKYRELCDDVFLQHKGDRRTPCERYWDRCNIDHGTRKMELDLRRQIKMSVERVGSSLEEYYKTGHGYSNMLELVLEGEFNAMLYKGNVSWCKCKGCGNYFIGERNTANYCSKEYIIGEFNDVFNEPVTEMYFVSPCNPNSMRCLKYMVKKKSNLITSHSLHVKNRIINKMKSYQLSNKDMYEITEAVSDVINKNEARYVAMLVEGDDERNKRVLEEYERIIIEAIDGKQKELFNCKKYKLG